MSGATPLPAPTAVLDPAARSATRLGLLGGSFDPPHLGHLHAARRARAAFQLEHVLFVPAARPPHKPERILAEASERLEMLALLLADEPAVSVWGVELARTGPSYTLDTLRTLRASVAPSTGLFLILGEDNLAGFPGWRGVEEIVRLAQPVVVHRSGAELDAVLAGPAVGALSNFARTRLVLGCLACSALEASSTELRETLAAGRAPPGSLPPRLAEYVRARGLYRRP